MLTDAVPGLRAGTVVAEMPTIGPGLRSGDRPGGYDRGPVTVSAVTTGGR
ncbi:hypothetical protein OIE13_16440 [Streptosporangium sp. NBC_01810]|nr:hypothetical protein [Streptosporangium sp. NBC_01810]WSA29323.1 hypothetical protein OIE13_16440 [Streptosporangium sp. NBC_01810]